MRIEKLLQNVSPFCKLSLFFLQPQNQMLIVTCWFLYRSLKPLNANLFSEGYPKDLSLCLTQSVSYLVHFYFQKLILGYFQIMQGAKFCLKVICTSQHKSNHQRSLAKQCHTQNFYLRCFKSDCDAIKSKFGLLIEQIEKTKTSKLKTTSKMKMT